MAEEDLEQSGTELEGAGSPSAPGVAGGEPAAGAEDYAPAPDDPWADELPAFAAEKWGAKSYSEVQQRLDGASRAEALASAQRELIQSLMAAREEGPQAPAAPAAGKPAGFDWYGFGTQQAFLAAYQADPAGTERRRKEALLDEMRQAQQPAVDKLEAQAFHQSWNGDIARVEQAYPDAKNPAVQEQVNQFIQGNAAWLTDLKRSHPQLNVVALAYKSADYDRLTKELAAANARLGGQRAGAGVARTSVGGPGSVQRTPAKTHADAARRAMEKIRAAGGTIPPEMRQYIEQMQS